MNKLLAAKPKPLTVIGEATLSGGSVIRVSVSAQQAQLPAGAFLDTKTTIVKLVNMSY